jgi:T5SS/PEP-CTERM-associated repeat protein
MHATRSIVQPLLLVSILVPAGLVDVAGGQCEITEDVRLPQTPGAAGEKFGQGVALSGDLLAISAPEGNGGFGSAKVFRWDGAAWVQDAELSTSDVAAADGFGSSIAMTADGQVIVVGAPGQPPAGAAYVFEQPSGGWTDMTDETAKLTPGDSTGGDNFGWCLDADWCAAVGGDVIVVGAPENGTGAAYVFEEPGGGWADMTQETQKLTPSDFVGNDDYFGWDVAIDGVVAVIGARGEDDDVNGYNDEGAAYVYRYSGTWAEEDKLEALDGVGGDYFGDSVAVEGDVAVVGSWKIDEGYRGAAYVFEYGPGSEWNQTQKLTPSDGAAGDLFGTSVAMDGSTIVIGAENDDSIAGSAYLYSFDGASWYEAAKLLASDRATGDKFGHAVALSAGRAVVGAPDDDHAGPVADAGSAYVFTVSVLCDLVWDKHDGGDFHTPANWQPEAVPGPPNKVFFDSDVGPDPSPSLYPVYFNSPATTDRLVVRSDREVRFDMDAVDYVVSGSSAPDEPSILVGTLAGGPDFDAKLRIENTGIGLHGVSGAIVSIGDAPASSGSVTVTGPGTLFESTDLFVGREGAGSFVVESGAWTDTAGEVSIATLSGSVGNVALTGAGSQWTTTGYAFIVGESGQASLTISGGAQLLSSTGDDPISLALQPGSSAAVTVSGAGSAWIESSAVMYIAREGPATVILDAGTIQAQAMEVLAQGGLLGHGSLVGDVFNTGEIRPGLGAAPDTTGVLTIAGRYVQADIPTGGDVEQSGNLFIDLTGTTPGTEYDQLIASGQGELGGGLFVSVAEPFEPQVSDTFAVVETGGNLSAVPPFDVAYITGLPPGMLITVDYGPGCGPTAGVCQVTLVVLDLEDIIDFDLPASFALDGLPSGAVAEDFNGDTYPDVAVAVPFTNSVFVLLNDGTGAFPSSVEIPVGNNPSAIATAPLDDNGSFDLAVTNADDNTVSVLTNNGSGVFVVDSTIPVGNNPSAIAAADFDEDVLGDVDLVVTNADDNTALILINEGGAVFAPGDLIPVGMAPCGIDPSDIDNDRDADDDLTVANHGAAAADGASSTVSTVLNLGGGNFGTAVDYDVGDGPVAIAAVDLDDDGSDDVVTANNGDGTVSVMLNNGDGTYAPAVNLPVGDQARSLAVVDLEGDTDLDLAVVVTDEVGERVVRILRNDLIHDGIVEDQLSFVLDQDLAQGENPVLVLSADVDQDGITDVITINEGIGGMAAGRQEPSLGVLINTSHTCLWDCGDGNGAVAVVDFLALLAQWGTPGSCDFDGDGVGVTDFLILLARWGPCP